MTRAGGLNLCVDARDVPVILRHASGTRYFLAVHEIQLAGDAVEPLDYQGRRYTFSHTTDIGDYEAPGRDTVYVFTEELD